MKKFKVTVTRTDEYFIDIDETIINNKALDDWSQVFHEVDTLEEFVENFAISWMRNEGRYFIEGYGYVKEYREDGQLRSVPYVDAEGQYTELPEDKYAKGISIKPISQDIEYETVINQL